MPEEQMTQQPTETQPEPKIEANPEPKAEPRKAMASNMRRLLAIEFAVFGIVVGVISFLINDYPYARMLALLIAIIVGAIVTYATKRALRSRIAGTGKWWASPLTIYTGMWIISWTILFNIYTVKPF